MRHPRQEIAPELALSTGKLAEHANKMLRTFRLLRGRFPGWGIHCGLLFLLTGCLENRAEATWPTGPSDRLGGETLLMGRPVSSPGKHIEISTLPIALHVDGWWRDANGNLQRGELLVSTPQPWWQNFPFDILTDVTPWPQPIHSSATLAITPVPILTLTDLHTAAQRAGYFSP